MTERQRRMWTGATVALTVAAVALWGLCWAAGVL